MKKISKKDKSKLAVNTSLLNSISPKGLKFNKNGFDLDQNYCVGMSVTRYPTKANLEWLTDVCNLKSTMSCLTFSPENNPEEILRAVGNSVSNNRLIADGLTTSDPVDRARAKKIVDDGSQFIDKIANNNEIVGNLSYNLMVIGNNTTDANLKVQAVKNKFSGRRFNASILPFMQKDIFKAVSPCDFTTELLEGATNQLMPISTLLGGFPFAFSGYNDGEGFYFGKDNIDMPIIVDSWKRGRDRTNSNMVIIGSTGSGKSTSMKHLMSNEWETGTKFIIIDPQGEYKDICKKLNGDWIDVAGGTGGKINPLHIYGKPKEDELETEEYKSLSELAKHINNLEIFFKLYLDLSPILTAILKECLELTYFKKGIDWETDVGRLNAKDYPIMSDLYDVILKKADENEKALKRNEVNYYKELSILIRSVAEGSDSFLWNGYSTVSTQKDFVVFDTSAVNNSSSNIITTLYHTVLNYCEDYLYRNKDERVILVCDEAHMMIDKRLPQTLSRLAKIERTCRKFESAIWICSHLLNDFLDEAIKKEGQVLLDLPNIKLLMPPGKGQDLQALKQLYGLTDAEEEVLMSGNRGDGILFIGARHLFIHFDIPQYRFDDMGTGGGR
ncbi:MAG: ATP-binding protein [Oscillospiraceae bacterium]